MVISWLLMAASANASLQWLGPENGVIPHSKSEVLIESAPQQLASDRSRHRFLYEADGQKNRVLQFTEAGTFVQAWGWGVGDGAKEFEHCGPGEPLAGIKPEFALCVGRNGEGNGFGGTEPGEFAKAVSIAVDPENGHVFVGSPLRESAGVVSEFTETGEYLESFGITGTAAREDIVHPSESGLAVDDEGTVYLADEGETFGHRLLKFQENGVTHKYAFVGETLNGQFEKAPYLAVDDKGSIYVSEPSRLLRFDASDLSKPAWKSPGTGAGAVKEAQGITINPETGLIYWFSFKEAKWHEVTPEGAESDKVETFEGAKEPTEEAAIGATFNPSASISGSAPGVLYASEPNSTVKKAPSRLLAFGGPPVSTAPPEVTGLASEHVEIHDATISGIINPLGVSATYHFEYGDEGSCASTACSSTAPLATGNVNEGVHVTASLTGLTAGRTYHFRLAAEDQFGVTVSEEAVFATPEESAGSGGEGGTGEGGSAAWPADFRRFEMVSPADKLGGEVFPLNTHFGNCSQCEPGRNAQRWPQFSSPSGESVVYEGEPFGTGGATAENEYRAERTAAGWKTADLSPELGSAGRGRGYRVFSSDLSTGILAQSSPRLGPAALPEGQEDLYVDSGGALSPLLTRVETEEPFSSFVAGGSADLSHVVFETHAALTGETEVAPTAPTITESEQNLYEVTDGELRLVNVLPGNVEAVQGAAIGSGKEMAQNTESAPDVDHAVSSDGSRIFWSSTSTGQVYVREDGVETRQIPDAGKFLIASEASDKVLLSDGHLYDLETGEAEDLTSGKGGFEGILGASSDLSRVYFVDTAVLTGERDQIGRSALAGGHNLYAYDAKTSTTGFIGTLSAADGSSESGITGDWVPSSSDRLAEASPSGEYLAFESSYPFTPDTEDCEGAKLACDEVFEYDAQSASVTCVSCNPATPGLKANNGSGKIPVIQVVGSSMPEPRYVANNGRMFFNSRQALSPHDNAINVEQVYEFEPDHVGTCEAQAGCVQLISPGDSSEDSSFFSTDEAGVNAFFTTRQAILPEDHDDLVDLYDAREHGGFEPAPASPPCSGEGCLGAPTFVPMPATPSSALLNGAGNLQPATQPKPTIAKKAVKKRCKKGRVRNKHGKCVRKPTHGSHSKRGHKATGRTGR